MGLEVLDLALELLNLALAFFEHLFVIVCLILQFKVFFGCFGVVLQLKLKLGYLFLGLLRLHVARLLPLISHYESHALLVVLVGLTVD